MLRSVRGEKSNFTPYHPRRLEKRLILEWYETPSFVVKFL